MGVGYNISFRPIKKIKWHTQAMSKTLCIPRRFCEEPLDRRRLLARVSRPTLRENGGVDASFFESALSSCHMAI
jgi:hypothetical protein